MNDDLLSDSGIRRVSDFSPYLDAMAGLGADLELRQRSNLIFLERCLNAEWRLGQNSILSWCPFERGLLALIVPHYAMAEYTAAIDADSTTGWRLSEGFIKSLISGQRRLAEPQLRKVARLLEVEPRYIELRQPLDGSEVELKIIEKMIKRYGISYVDTRAVALFDIVGFSLLSPFEQMTQLNSLSYSLNSAQSKMMERRIGISFARSTTGDGFYIWNRDLSPEASANLYHFMHLVLADNAIARRRAIANSVPNLRTAFHIGSCYEFHQAEGLNPTIHDFIVGDVTIELARMVERAMPEQILVGDFHFENPAATGDEGLVDAIRFVHGAQRQLARLNGVELSGERISSIKCYLTGEPLDDSAFSVRRLVIHDKHGLSRNVFNAKVNIYRESADPILLGIEDRMLREPSSPFGQSELLTPD